MFIRYLAESAQNVAKAESKPRRNIQYKDLGRVIIVCAGDYTFELTIVQQMPFLGSIT